jgi:hypothetical protein
VTRSNSPLALLTSTNDVNLKSSIGPIALNSASDLGAIGGPRVPSARLVRGTLSLGSSIWKLASGFPGVIKHVLTRFASFGETPVAIGGLPISTGVGSASSWKVYVERNFSGSVGKMTLAVGVKGGLSLLIDEDGTIELLCDVTMADAMSEDETIADDLVEDTKLEAEDGAVDNDRLLMKDELVEDDPDDWIDAIEVELEESEDEPVEAKTMTEVDELMPAPAADEPVEDCAMEAEPLVVVATEGIA